MTVAIGNMTAQWADVNTIYTGIGMDANATAYHANSKLINLSVNGNSKFSLDADGNAFAKETIKANNIVLTEKVMANDIYSAHTVISNTVFTQNAFVQSIVSNTVTTENVVVQSIVSNTVTTGNVIVSNTISTQNVIAQSIQSKTIKSDAFTVAQLPNANTSGIGTRLVVTDASNTIFLMPVANGGSNIVPVFSNGNYWLIG